MQSRDVNPVSKNVQNRAKKIWNSQCHLYLRIAQILERVPCLSHLSTEYLERAARSFRVERYTKGETILCRGHETLGIIAGGSARVVLWTRKDVDPGGSVLLPIELAKVGPAELIGELCVLNIPVDQQQEEVISSGITDALLLPLADFARVFDQGNLGTMERIKKAAAIKMALRLDRANELRSSPAGSPRNIMKPEWSKLPLNTLQLRIPELDLTTVENITKFCGPATPTGASYRAGLDERGEPLRPTRLVESSALRTNAMPQRKKKVRPKLHHHKERLTYKTKETEAEKEASSNSALKAEAKKLRMGGMVASRGGLRLIGIENMFDGGGLRCPQHQPVQLSDDEDFNDSSDDESQLRRIRKLEDTSRFRLAANNAEIQEKQAEEERQKKAAVNFENYQFSDSFKVKYAELEARIKAEDEARKRGDDSGSEQDDEDVAPVSIFDMPPFSDMKYAKNSPVRQKSMIGKQKSMTSPLSPKSSRAKLSPLRSASRAESPVNTTKSQPLASPTSEPIPHTLLIQRPDVRSQGVVQYVQPWKPALPHLTATSLTSPPPALDLETKIVAGHKFQVVKSEFFSASMSDLSTATSPLSPEIREFIMKRQGMLMQTSEPRLPTDMTDFMRERHQLQKFNLSDSPQNPVQFRSIDGKQSLKKKNSSGAVIPMPAHPIEAAVSVAQLRPVNDNLSSTQNTGSMIATHSSSSKEKKLSSAEKIRRSLSNPHHHGLAPSPPPIGPWTPRDRMKALSPAPTK